MVYTLRENGNTLHYGQSWATIVRTLRSKGVGFTKLTAARAWFDQDWGKRYKTGNFVITKGMD